MADSPRTIHNDPHFLIRDQHVLIDFLRRFAIEPPHEPDNSFLETLCAAFANIPYENLTKIIKSGTVITPNRAKRLPDEVLRDYLHYGSGGTCFSLTATFIALFNAFGIEAHPILADRHYGTDTHCALVFSQESKLSLLDPGYLIHRPVRLPTTEPVSFSTGVSTIELQPHDAGRTVELLTVSHHNTRSRLTYKVTPLDGAAFGRAWERSFAWDMMTYPILTGVRNGVQYYLQGNQLRIREKARTRKQVISSHKQYALVSRTVGIDQRILTQALSVV